MKKILSLIFCSTVIFAQQIKHENLHELKRQNIDLLDNHKMQQISFLTSDLMWHNGTLNKDNQGQNFINSLEDIKIRPNFELRSKYYTNKDDKILNTKVFITNTSYYEDTSIELGLSTGYQKNLNKNLDENSFSFGLNSKANISDTGFRIYTENEFIYSKLKTNLLKESNYYSFVGGVNLATKLGDKLYFEPNLILTYGYNLKTSFEDNDSKYLVDKGLNLLVGLGGKIGFETKTKVNFKGSIGAMVGKLAINKNKYNLFDHDLETKKDNLIINIGQI